MHARKKVPKDEAKEKERLAKAQKFYGALTKLLEKKKSGCKDRILLKPIADLLYVNPDFSTLWNYRREIFIAFKEEIEKTESKEDELNSKAECESTNTKIESNCDDGGGDTLIQDSEKDVPNSSKVMLWEEFDKLCRNELSFIENCLQVNYKSYGCWHHRQWIIQFMNQPDLEREVQLCNQFLQQDDRNFHCWDYRRFAVKMLQVDIWTELKFSNEKIDENFSNFSSWHYRSSLLKQLYLGGKCDEGKIISMIEDDYERIENAIYTDPTDQSIWFYLRWLFTIYSNGLKIFENEEEKVDSSKISAMSSVKINRFCCNPLGNCNSFCFVIELQSSRFLELNPGNFLQIKLNQSPIPIARDGWNLASSNKSGSVWYSILKEFDFPKNNDGNKLSQFEFEDINYPMEKLLTISFDHSRLVDGGRKCCLTYTNRKLSDLAKHWDRVKIDPEKFKTLSDLLEFEPDNKWLNYTLAWLESNDDIMNSTIDKLIQIDQLRTNYYNDLRSKIVLRKAFTSNQSLLSSVSLSLCNLNLHSFRNSNQLIHIQHLDLSQNCLLKLGTTFSSLVNLKILILDSNRIYLVDQKLFLPNLTILSLADNKIQKLQTIQTIINNFVNLKHLILFNNAIIVGTTKNQQEIDAINENSDLKIYFEKSSNDNNENAAAVMDVINAELQAFKLNYDCCEMN